MLLAAISLLLRHAAFFDCFAADAASSLFSAATSPCFTPATPRYFVIFQPSLLSMISAACHYAISLSLPAASFIRFDTPPLISLIDYIPFHIRFVFARRRYFSALPFRLAFMFSPDDISRRRLIFTACAMPDWLLCFRFFDATRCHVSLAFAAAILLPITRHSSSADADFTPPPLITPCYITHNSYAATRLPSLFLCLMLRLISIDFSADAAAITLASLCRCRDMPHAPAFRYASPLFTFTITLMPLLILRLLRRHFRCRAPPRCRCR